ncbi:MAG TPA: ABC transporter permease [Symbiobacteriaceae bacterium]|nr:ABC transporter permease [Symbiobacteriaceae bacterium]
MRRSLAIATLHLRTTFKSKGALVTMFAMPLVLTLIFGVLTQGGGSEKNSQGFIHPVAVVDEDQTFLSRTLIERLKTEQNLAVRVTTRDESKKLFADQKVAVALVLPAQFQAEIAAGQTPEVQLLTGPGSNTYLGVGPTLRRHISLVAQEYQLALRMLPPNALQDEAQIGSALQKVTAERTRVTTSVTDHKLTRVDADESASAATGASVGFTVTFVMMQVFMMSGVILTERKNGTWGRLLTTPNSRVTVMSGYLLSFFLTGMAQFTILVLATKYLFGIQWGPMLPLLAMGAGTVLSSAGMGLFLASIVKTFEQQISVGILFVNATAMLGGAYWDLSMVSDTMRRIGYLTPQAWAIDGFKEVILRGGTWSGIEVPLAVLLGITVVFMTAGLLRVRYE